MMARQTSFRHYNPTGAVYLNFMNGTSVISSAVVGGNTDWSLVGTGDFNGDGKTDILWQYNPTGAVYENLMNGGSVIGSAVFSANADWSVLGTGDFNGDGKDRHSLALQSHWRSVLKPDEWHLGHWQRCA